MNHEEEIKEINRKLVKLETHVINLIIPIQNICDALKSNSDIKYLIQCLKGPIPINDNALKIILADFTRQMNKFSQEVDRFCEKSEKISLGELKFIGKKLNELEKIFTNILEKPETKNIELNFTVDGYQLVKKPRGYEENNLEEPKKHPDDALMDVLNTLSERERKMVIYRIGLLKEKGKTYSELSEMFGVSREKCRAIFEKAIRKLRDPKRKKLMDKVTNLKLRRQVYGEV